MNFTHSEHLHSQRSQARPACVAVGVTLPTAAAAWLAYQAFRRRPTDEVLLRHVSRTGLPPGQGEKPLEFPEGRATSAVLPEGTEDLPAPTPEGEHPLM